MDLLSPARYVEQDSETNLAPKMQLRWGKEIHAAAARRLGPLEAALGDCDLVASHARANPVGPILNLRLFHRFNRFTPAQFVAWLRWQFRVPAQPSSPLRAMGKWPDNAPVKTGTAANRGMSPP